jgi:hypothetical protein
VRSKRTFKIAWRDQPIFMTVGQVAALLLIFVYLPLSGGISWLGALAIFGFLVAFGIVQGFPDLPREWDSFLSVVAFVVVAMALGGSHARMQFYEVAAQVIPVLFLALAVQSRFSIIGQFEPDQRLRLLTVCALVVGEFTSLSALSSGKPGGLRDGRPGGGRHRDRHFRNRQ